MSSTTVEPIAELDEPANQQSRLKAMETQSYKVCSLVAAARLLSQHFMTLDEQENAVAEVLLHADEEVQVLFALIGEALGAETKEPAAA